MDIGPHGYSVLFIQPGSIWASCPILAGEGSLCLEHSWRKTRKPRDLEEALDPGCKGSMQDEKEKVSDWGFEDQGIATLK